MAKLIQLDLSNIERYLHKGYYNRDWYSQESSKIIELLPEFYDLPILRTFAVTSMTTNIEANVTLALKALLQMRRGEQFKGFLPNQIKYLNLIKNGFDVPGRKIMSFINALEGNHSSVVVDIWMCKAFGTIQERNLRGRKYFKAPTKGEYDAIENYSIEDALRCGLSPRQYQASIWAAIKKEQSVISKNITWSSLIVHKKGFLSF